MSLVLTALLCLASLAGAVLPGLAAARSPSAAAAGPTLMLYSFLCPAAYTGPDFAADCRSPVADIEFTATPVPTGNTLIDWTGIGGSVTFAALPAGFYEIRGGPPGEFVQNAITCHQGADPAAAVTFFPRDNQTIRLALTDVDVTCIWFSVPEDLRGDA